MKGSWPSWAQRERQAATHSLPVCDHGHPQTERWSGKDVDECWYGHPITTGLATCTCPGSGRDVDSVESQGPAS